MRPIRSPAAPGEPEEIATVRIELRGSDPAIWRQVDVPTAITHENHAEAKQWLDDNDPDTLDELPIKYALGRIAARRRAARTRLAKKPSHA